jgi:hypothetical protein
VLTLTYSYLPLFSDAPKDTKLWHRGYRVAGQRATAPAALRLPRPAP